MSTVGFVQNSIVISCIDFKLVALVVLFLNENSLKSCDTFLANEIGQLTFSAVQTRLYRRKDLQDCLRLIFRSSHRMCSVREGVLRNFTKFTGKHLCQSFFFNKVAGLRSATWHAGKVGPKTLRWDPRPRTLGWDPKVRP